MWQQLLPDLFLFEDACNVYVLKQGDEGIAIDFGSGQWLKALHQIGVQTLRHVLLTHAHRDQCYGLNAQPEWPFEVHCSAEDVRFFVPDRVTAFWRAFQAGGCPVNYAAPRLPLPFVKGNLGDALELRWGDVTVAAVPTPGHTRGALSYVVNWHGKAVVFCGDASHAGGKIHQPFHLEWDHWTGEGALAAWYGLERLGACRIDVLCPSHGPIVDKGAMACLLQTQKRVMAFVKAKGSVCAGEKDRWFCTEELGNGMMRVLPDLYHFGGNSYLIVGDRGEGLVIDPTVPSIERIQERMQVAGVTRLTAAMATHYHRDHSDGLNWLREKYEVPVWLHPWVAEPLINRNRMDVPWLPAESIVPDRLLPEAGTFLWNRYRFDIQPFPGQTWWHCAFDTEIFGQRVLFSGDNFQPPTRWNGTGGFCAYNGSRFIEGFLRSAHSVLDVKPDLICNGHGCIYTFDAGHYRRILKWAIRTENAVRNLCVSDGWLNDYDPRAMRWTPFRSEGKAGQTATLSFEVENGGGNVMTIAVQPMLPEGWTAQIERRRLTIPGGKVRKAVFEIYVPAETATGRYVIGGEVVLNGRLFGEGAVALVDI